MSKEEGVYLRKAGSNDRGELIKSFDRSKSLHLNLIDSPSHIENFINQEHRHLVCLKQTDSIVGFYNISGIIKGYFHSAFLGFAVFEPYQRKGYMSKGMTEILRFAFENLNLHRLEANIQPENHASKSLVEKAGFIKEGYSKNNCYSDLKNRLNQQLN